MSGVMPAGVGFAPRKQKRPLPGGFSVLESQSQRLPAFADFARQYQIGAILLDLRSRDVNLLARLELDTHVVEKFLGTKKDLVRVRGAFHRDVNDGLSARRRNELQFAHHALDFGLSGRIVFW